MCIENLGLCLFYSILRPVYGPDPFTQQVFEQMEQTHWANGSEYIEDKYNFISNLVILQTSN